MVVLNHVGLVCRSEASCDAFYGGLLGLEKQSVKELSASLAEPLFGVTESCPMLYYGNDKVLFEIFISTQIPRPDKQIAHVCLEVPDVEAFLTNCRQQDVCIKQAPKGDRMITFIEDADGNAFEIKQTTQS